MRQARDTHEKADECREKDTEPGDQQGIEQTDQESTPVGVGLVVLDQTLEDTKTGLVGQEAETGR